MRIYPNRVFYFSLEKVGHGRYFFLADETVLLKKFCKQFMKMMGTFFTGDRIPAFFIKP
jgi:hypothetical protein